MSRPNVVEQAACLRSVQDDGVSNPGKVHRDNVWLFVLHKSNMTDEGFIENAVNRLAVVKPAPVLAVNAIVGGPCECRHDPFFQRL
jgi:hypothetical protein